MMNKSSNDLPPNETALIKPGEGLHPVPAPLVVQVGGGEQKATGAFSFGQIWNAFRLRLVLSLPLGILLGAGACAALWKFSEEKFKSSATLKISEKQPYIAFQTIEHSRDFAETQVELLRGRYLISTAIETDGLSEIQELKAIRGKEDPVTWISRNLKVSRIGRSELYDVSYLGRQPESAQKVTAAIVKAYTAFQASESDSQRQFVLSRLKEEQEYRAREIEKKRANLREIGRQAGGDIIAKAGGETGAAVPSQASQRMAVLTSLRQKLVDAEVDLEIKRAALAAHRQEKDETVSITERDLEEALAHDRSIVTLEHQLQTKRTDLQSRDPKFKGYQQLQTDVERLEKELAARKEKRRPSLKAEAERTVSSRRELNLQQEQSEVEKLEKLIGLLNEKIDGEKKEQTRKGDKSLELEFARSELDHSEEVSEKITERMVHLTTESRAQGPVQVIEKATLPEFPDGPSLVKKLAMAGIGGFLLPFALFLGWDLLYRRVFEREQLEREVKLHFVTEVAALPTRPMLMRMGREKAYKQQLHLFEESVNTLRTTLSVDSQLHDARVFVMASAVSGEGKSNLSSQLAMSWSHAEPGKVIIVDADLRAPNLHELFEIPLTPGLAEVLRGECTLEDVTLMDWGDKLYIVPAGDLKSDSASQLFAGPRFRECVAKLRSQYHKVMFDVPPVLCASETLIVGKQADAVVMCTLHDHSRAGQFKQAYDRLVGSGVNVVGAVLNGAPVRQYSYAYRGYGVS
jgi:capsular exopolysaccharide synthesis family protein